MEDKSNSKKEKLIKQNDTYEDSIDQKNSSSGETKPYVFQAYIFVLTFFTYAILHTSREAWAFLKDKVDKSDGDGIGLSSDELGTIDMVFLIFYSLGLYISGVLGDNLNKKILIGFGYIFVSGSCIMIGMGGIWRIKTIWYYLVFFSINGVVQSVGWPSVVAVMGNWFGKKGRGFWFGVWTSNPNVGNIIGSLLCNLLNSQIGLSWMWTWIIISIIIGAFGIFNMFFMIEHPSRVGLIIKEGDEGDLEEVIEELEHEDHENHENRMKNEEDMNNKISVKDESHISVVDDGHEAKQSINFFKAWLIPGVLQFSICYLGLKLANYGIMLWLPKYAADHLKFNDDEKTLIASLYDIGTIAGSILLGLLSDWMYGKRTPICFVGLLLATIGHVFLIFLTSSEKVLLYILIFILGFFVGGISNIISGTACADLGKHDALKHNSKALSTVTGIVDGTGSIGAALGQKGIGYLQDNGSWTGVFILMTCFVFLSSIPLVCISYRDVKEIAEIRKLKKQGNKHEEDK